MNATMIQATKEGENENTLKSTVNLPPVAVERKVANGIPSGRLNFLGLPMKMAKCFVRNARNQHLPERLLRTSLSWVQQISKGMPHVVCNNVNMRKCSALYLGTLRFLVIDISIPILLFFLMQACTALLGTVRLFIIHNLMQPVRLDLFDPCALTWFLQFNSWTVKQACSVLLLFF